MKLASVTIPKDVINIANEAFLDCFALTEIHFKGMTPPSASYNTFNELHKTCKLYVPKGAYSSYRTSNAWCNFTYILEEVSTSTPKITVDEIKIYSEDSNIVIERGNIGDIIRIYNLAGSLLHTIKITDDVVRIKVEPKNFYIVRIGEKSFKIAHN